MKISYNWLSQYISLPANIDELSAILTDLGLEVSSVTKFSSIEGGLQGIVTAQVVTCSKHPNSDHLSLTTVNVGNENLLHIVCGASNVAEGQKVLVATVGATLYGTAEPLTIKKTKIRGEISEGMICAEDEIGVGYSHDGIMVLPPQTPIGMPAAQYFGIETDTVLEVDLTPNRIDAASHIGIARDLAAFFNKTTPTSYSKPGIALTVPQNQKPIIDVEVENTQACPRYMGLHIANIKTEASPQWLQNRIRAIGLKPINNIVDISNYVMFETGQPLHMFDAAQITGKKVLVKTLARGTSFITLDGIERSLSDTDLMICNTHEPMCIAGVFGGIKAGISQNTTEVFIESAYFNPTWVRRTAKRHALATDSSFRFERGADPEMAPYALMRAADLVLQLAGGQITGDIVDVYRNTFKPLLVECNHRHFERLVGVPLSQEQVFRILKSLEFEIVTKKHDTFTLKVPLYRVDVTREADVIEEFLRIYGYNNVTLPEKMLSSLSYTQKPDRSLVENHLAEMLSSMGLSEIMCTSFTKQRYFDNFFPAKTTISVHNALSNDLNCMRPTLLFGGLESIARNINFQNRNLMLYEFGRSYQLKPDKEDKPGMRYHETDCLGIWVTGNARNAYWNDAEKKTSFFTLKALAENVLLRCGISLNHCNIQPLDHSIFHYGTSYMYNNNCLAQLGSVEASALNLTDVSQEVYYAEINIGQLLQAMRGHSTKVESLPRYPKVERDLALLIDHNVQYESIRQLAFKTECKLLKEVQLFDVYQGKNIPEGKKSYAISFTLQDNEKTLTDKEIDKAMKRLTDVFARELGATLR